VIGEPLGSHHVRFDHARVCLLELFGDPAQFDRRARVLVESSEQQHGVMGTAEHVMQAAKLSVE